MLFRAFALLSRAMTLPPWVQKRRTCPSRTPELGFSGRNRLWAEKPSNHGGMRSMREADLLAKMI